MPVCVSLSAWSLPFAPLYYGLWPIFKKRIHFCLIPGQQIWQQINLRQVCFHAKGKRPGEFQYLGEGKLLGAMKLVHREGTVRCVANTAYDSRWGCYHYPTLVKFPLNVVVTDNHNNIIFPAEKYFKNTGLWYNLPFTDALHSDALVFTNYNHPVYLARGARVRIWYGEDLKNWYNGDNGGRVCVDVYGHLQWLEKCRRW